MQVLSEPPARRVTHQARIEVPEAAAFRLAEALEGALDPSPIAVGVFERGQDRFEVFAHYEAAPPRQALLKLIAEVANGDGVGPLQIEALPLTDWVTLSQGKRGKVSAGRFLVYGSHDKGKVPRTLLAIEIDAGQAFGTAHHASTRGCLFALDDALKRGRPREVVDIGTGSGVLAIAAAKALKRKVVASDNDPVAVATAAENARKNGAASLLNIVTADGFGHPRLRRAKADLVFANLLEGALYALAPQLARHVAHAGIAVLSGLTETQTRAIEARARAHGFILKKRIILEGWTTLVIARVNARRVQD
ncbi:MAG TPA: 50S ribosomal protein L11 methyltransferase [Methyloceanibacter sp.]|nr:50S ribosomal protein L11 methyltransferase [Methyloceanibacter sp.]